MFSAPVTNNNQNVKNALQKILKYVTQTLLLYSRTFLVFSKYRENGLINFDQIFKFYLSIYRTSIKVI